MLKAQTGVFDAQIGKLFGAGHGSGPILPANRP
jgi:hypothetical protein